jgi:hypothetical protein
VPQKRKANTNTKKKMSDAVKTFYASELANLVFLKNQQWQITNYSLIAYAATYTLSQYANSAEKLWLTALVISAYVFAALCMYGTQKSMTKARSRIFDIYENYFSDDEQSEFELWETRPTFNHDPRFFYGLLVANSAAMLTTVYLISRIELRKLLACLF